MRVLVIHAHPVETSFNAALHAAVVDSLAAASHEVDDLDLYAEDFEPCLSRQEHLDYHEDGPHREHLRPYIDRLLACNAIVLVYPVWNFGYPAILKGFMDRVFLPEVSFKLHNGLVYPNLTNVSRLAAVTTYGGHRWRAIAAGDPPRKHVTRVMRATVKPGAAIRYLALYDMNRVTDVGRRMFVQRVRQEMRRF